MGNIYKGKVENVLGGMQAAFVNIGQERNGFLYMGDTLVDSRCLNSKMPPKRFNVSAGDVIMCQVVKDSFGQKGARLTMDITLPGYYVILLPLSVFFGVSRKIENPERRTHLEDFVRSVCPEGMGCIIRSAAKKRRIRISRKKSRGLYCFGIRCKRTIRERLKRKSFSRTQACLKERFARRSARMWTKS